MEYKVEGLKALNARLQQLPVKMEKKILRNALRAGAVVMRDDAKARVRKKYGLLAKSLRVSTDGRRGRVEANVKAGGRKTKAFYGHILEFGAGSRYTGSGTKSKRRKYIIEPRKDARTIITRTFTKKGKLRKVAAEKGAPAKMLRIPMVGPTKDGKGLFRFAKRVLHPGAKAHPYMRPALQAKGKDAIDTFADNVRRNLDQALK